MQDNSKHKDTPDRFSASVRSKLDNHRLPVDAACWNAIEAQVNARPRKTYRWIGGLVAAAAAVITALLLLPPPQQPVNEQKEQPLASSLPTAPGLDTAAVVSRPAVALLPGRGSTTVVTAWPVAPDTVALLTVELEADVMLAAADLPKARKRADSGPEPTYRPAARNVSVEAVRTNKQTGGWLLAANLGTAGQMPSLLNNEVMDDDLSFNPDDPGGIPPLPPSASDLAALLPLNQYSDVHYAPPLSFGFTVRKKLSKQVAVESGLVYTYLQSRMRLSSTIQYDSRLNLHYLGIPVSLVLNLWDHSNWNLYLAVGGMVEKGLRSVYSQHSFYQENQASTVARSGIDGLQWSLQLSGGVSYRFHPHWGLYLEPRYSYYFDNKQPISIRTDKPAAIGINAGIRYEF